MTIPFKRVALGLAAALLSVGVYAAAQDRNTNKTPSSFRASNYLQDPAGQQGPGRGRGRFGGPGGGPMGMLPMFGPELELTDAQREQLKSLRQSHNDEWKALADRSRSAHDALQAAVTADSVNESVIRERSAEVAAVEADMAVARAHAHAEMLQILTADQKTKLKTLEARRPTPPPSGRRGQR